MARKPMKNEHVSLKKKDERWIIKINVPIILSLPATKSNTRFLYILLRMLCDENGNRLLSFQIIANLLNFESRQNIHNFWREYVACSEEILDYLTRKVELKKAVPLIQKTILSNILLPLSQHYRDFVKAYPHLEMCYSTFSKYATKINSNSLLEEVQKLFKEASTKLNVEHLLQLIASQEKAPIVCDRLLELIDSNTQKSPKTSHNIELSRFNLCMFVNFLVGSAVSYQTIATLLDVSKGTVHNLLYEITDLKSLIINSISKWSGSISIDEKYIKIKGVWHYVISIVDLKTGIPLYWDVYDSIKKESYQQCFLMFKQLYGTPKLIVSDGSKSLAAARKMVFPNVKAQLCMFHKIRNLMKRLYESKIPYHQKEKLKIKILKVFRRKTTGGRKKGIRDCSSILPSPAAEYLKHNVLAYWSLLRNGLTANTSERFNRKIEKVCSVRYGLQSINSANAIINALVLKDLITNGRAHLSENSIVASLNISQLCQESVKWNSVGQLFSKNNSYAA